MSAPEEMTLKVIAHIRTAFPTKFGIPRQSGLVDSLRGEVIFTPEYRNADAVRGLVYGEAAAVQYSSYALMMLVRLDPLDADTLDSLRAQALSDMKSGELQDSIQSYGAQLSHALDSAAMKKMPASKIKNEQ